MADIFLSYAREDLAQAKQLAQALESAGLSVWWDRRLLVGQQFSTEIEQAIDAAQGVVVMWSENAVHSRWVRDEASAGADQGKLCPVTIDGGQVPMGFRQFHTIDLTGWGGQADEPEIHALVRQLTVGDTKRKVEVPRARVSDPVLAVLPFDNLSTDEEMRYFSDGISEEILVRLMRGSKIKLIGRASSFKYRDERKAAAAEHLNCTHILDGSIRRSGDRVRTTVHLLEIGSEQAIWSNRFDDKLEDILDTQDRIAEAIAKSLDSQFKRGAERKISGEIYDRYLKAVDLTRNFNRFFEAIGELERITEEAPAFADAWGRLAIVCAFASLVLHGAERDALHQKLQRAVAKSIRLDPANVEAIAAEYRAIPLLGEFLQRGIVISRVESFGANTALGQLFLSFHALETGRTRAGLHHAREAYALNPDDGLAKANFGYCLQYMGNVDESREVLLDCLGVEPANPSVALTLMHDAVMAEDWELLDKLLADEWLAHNPLPQHEAFFLPMRAMQSRDNAKKEAAADKLVTRSIELKSLDILSTVWIAVLVGSDRAYELVDRLRIGLPRDNSAPVDLAHYSPVSLFNVGYGQVRENPRFPMLAARIGLAQYWVQTGEWPDCADELERLYPFKQGCIEAARTVEIDPFLPPGH